MTSESAAAPVDSRLLFRFGFLLENRSTPGCGPEWDIIKADWRREELGELAVWLHPETVFAVDRDAANGDFTAVLGDAWFSTPPYDRDPCRYLADKAIDEAPPALDALNGRFAIIVRRGASTFVFNDAFGTRSICYRAGPPWAVASHAELLALAFATGRDPDTERFLASRLWQKLPVLILPGDITPYAGIVLLPPNNAWHVEMGRTERYWPRQAPSPTRFEQFAEECDRYFEGMARALAGRSIWLSITGGVDSRLLLAAFHHFGVDFKTVTWTSLNFEPWEAEPVEQIKAILGNPHAVVDASNSAPSSLAAIGLRNGGGRARRPHPTVAGMGRLLADDPGAVFVRGVGAEVIRGFYQTKSHRLGDLTASQMASAYAARVNASDNDEAEFVTSAFEGFHARANCGDTAVRHFDPSDLFYWEHRMGTWASESLNSMDPACRNLLGFNSRPLAVSAFGLPPEERLTKALFLRVIERYNRDLARIHCQ